MRTSRLLLRPFTVADAPAVRRLAGVYEVARTTLNIPHPYHDGMADAWIVTHAASFARREMAVFAIAAPDDTLLGAISLRLDAAHDRAEMGYWIGLPYWGQGYATEAAMRLRDFGFDELAVHRLHAAYLPRNPASGRVMSKIGMRFEGLHRSHYFKDGQFEDVIEFAMLRTDARPSGAETPSAPRPVSTSTAEHYNWGDGCDGWHLVRTSALSVSQERMPAGAHELRHWHTRAYQYVHVVDGELTLEVDGTTHLLSSGAGLEIGPGTPHQAINLSIAPVNFLVTSQPPSHGDRVIDHSDGERHG